MSLATVTDLSHEVRRLAIAGAALGRKDHRLQKLLPPLQAAGKKVPVFAQLAVKTEALLTADKSKAAVTLLELNALISAVLKTQGKTGIEGKIVPSEINDDQRTHTQTLTSREIAELQLSLQDNGGNLRDIRRSFKRGNFSDVRMAEQAVAALQTHSIAVSEFAASHLLPPHGKAIIPLLINAFEPSARKAAQRTLKAIYNCDTESGEQIARQILDPAAPQHFKLKTDDISTDIRSTALQILSNNDSDAGILHDHLKAKHKALRTSAMQTLLRHGNTEVRRHLESMFQGSESKINEAIEALPDLSHENDRIVVLQRANHYLPTLRKMKLSTAETNKFLRILELMGDSSPHQDTYSFLLEIIGDAKALQEICTTKNEHIVINCLETVIKACPEHGTPAQDMPICMAFHKRLTTLCLLQHYGPEDALQLLEFIDPKDRNRGIYEIFKYGDGPRELPAPEQWPPEWVALSLDSQLFDLTHYLIAGSPSLVLNHILQNMKTLDQVELIFALTIDPACAVQLSKKNFGFRNSAQPLYIKLLGAVDQRDSSLVTSCLDKMQKNSKAIHTNHHIWIRACRKKLTNYLS